MESVTTLTGSVRGDVQVLSGRIIRRCKAAFDLSEDDEFERMATNALSLNDRCQDIENCKSAECRLIMAALIQLEKDMALLEIRRNLRNKVTNLVKQDLTPKHFFIAGRDEGLNSC